MPTLSEFIRHWQATTRSERSGAQEHFLELCAVLGQPTPAQLDPTGTRYTFEKGAAKTGGGAGFADVWWQGHFAWEYKRPGKDLAAAYQQLLQYREDLENPPLLIVCDLQTFQVHTNFTNTAKRVYAFTLADLATTAPLPGTALTALDVLRACWDDPARLRPAQTTAEVTEAAAREFAELAANLRAAGTAPEVAAHFLMRLLFCLFAEDIRLLPAKLFTDLVETNRTRPLRFKIRLEALFAAMATGGDYGNDEIRHFNGGLFEDHTVLDLSEKDLAILSRAAALDWASIEPAIFGTLFERSLDPAKRSQLGAHYTSRDDILLIVEPVLMAPLRRRWAAVQAEAAAILARRAATTRTQDVNQQQTALSRLLQGFAEEIARVRVLDPACGSGNFLYVALKRLLDLEKEVSNFAAQNGLSGFFPQANPAQLYGLELNPYAHELASVVVWIGYIQWLRDNGFGFPAAPILRRLDTIRHQDAILAHDTEGRPVEPPWPEADVIIGNPPFLGGNKMLRELGDTYVQALRELYDKRVAGGADLVSYWFERAREQIATGHARRAGLLATQGIRGGMNRGVLERIKHSGDIFWAQSDRNWILDGAHVHVSMIGFDDSAEQERNLNGSGVSVINADLTSELNLTDAVGLQENTGIAFKGTTKTGSFEIIMVIAQQMLSAKGNPNGKPNSDVVRPWVNGLDIAGHSRNMWIIDFGVDMPEEEAALYEMPFEYLKRHVYPVRRQNRQTVLAEKWWLYERPRPALRAAIERLDRYIVTPVTAKHRLFVWLEHPILPDQQLIVFARQDDYFFGLLHSKLHELWTRAMGTQLREAESGSRYIPTTTFETFPFPWSPGQEPGDDPRLEAIAAAARRLVQLRDAWLNPPGATEAELKGRTLTNLYNARPEWLAQAHARLDAAVLAAYGWPSPLADAEILERLLALNHARSAAGHPG